VQAVGTDWTAAASEHTWPQQFHHFRNAAMAWVGRRVPEIDYLRSSKAAASPAMPARKKARVLPPLTVHWQANVGTQIWVGGDNDLVIGWLTGTKRARYQLYKAVTHSMLKIVYQLHATECLQPPDSYSEVYNHVYREHNSVADNLAKQGHGKPLSLSIKGGRYRYLRVQFDGSKSSAGDYAVGFVIYGLHDVPNKQIELNDWQLVCEGGGAVQAKSVVQSELMACVMASLLAFAVAQRNDLSAVWCQIAGAGNDLETLGKFLNQRYR